MAVEKVRKYFSQFGMEGRVQEFEVSSATVELALEVWVTLRCPGGMRRGELPLPPADGSIGWPSQSSAGELALVVQIKESRWDDQFSYHLGPVPEL